VTKQPLPSRPVPTASRLAARYLRRAAFATAGALCLALYAYSPYAFPQLLDGEALAWAYRLRYLYLQATLWLLGPSGSIVGLAAKVAAVALLAGLALGAALLPLGIRRKDLDALRPDA
jgi:hypothetical protein